MTAPTLSERLIARANQLAEDHRDMESEELADLLREAAAEIERQAAEIARLELALDPRRWDRSLHEAWHRNIPDMMAAFRALREAADELERLESLLESAAVRLAKDAEGFGDAR